jgi:hypothetical protein
MSWWLLLVEVFVVWFLWVFAAVAGKAVADARRGIPEVHRGGVSILPVLPVFPLAFWGAALAVDLVARPWGTLVIAGFHALLGLVFAGSFARDVWRLRSLDRQA